MAVLAFTYLVMTDGTDTVTFSDGTGVLPGWPLADTGWGPQIAGLRTSPLGGRGPYADVEELITCNIISPTSAALCYANLDTLSRLLDKAERWWLRNEPIAPVLLKYAPQGSTIHSIAAPMKAIVLGRVGAAELNGVALPKDYDDAGIQFEINGVEVACLRRGAWTGATDATSASAAAANPTVMTRAFSATHPTSSPMSISIGGFQQATTPTIQAGYLCVGSQASDIQILEAEAAAGGVGWASQADAAGNARGGNVLRRTPSDTGLATTGAGTVLSLTTISGMVAVIAAVRNNSTTTTFLLQAILNGLSTAYEQTPQYLIDCSTLLPRLVMLGTVNGVGLENLRLTVQASAASGTLDIDYLIVVNLRDETCAIVAHDAIAMTNMGAGAATLDVLYNPTVNQNPTLQATRGSGLIPGVWRGPLPFQTTGINVYALWTATNGASWRFTTTAPAVLSVTLQATRYASFLSPQ